MTGSDKKLIEELEKRLCWYRDEATDEEFDAEEVDAICVMLQKLSPIEEPHMSKEEAYQNIMRRVREEEEDTEKSSVDGADEESDTDSAKEENNETKKSDGRKRVLLFGRKGYRAAILFIAVFGAVLLSLNMVTYAREDKSLFTMILERVGVFKVAKEEIPEEALVDFGEETGAFYDSWTELDSEIKSKIIVPGYIPSGYELYGVKYYSLKNSKKIKANYYDKGNGHLVIEISLLENSSQVYREMVLDEEACILLSEYSDEDTLYYAYEDEYICVILMKNSFYRISGNITLEEMIEVSEGMHNIK